MHDKIRKYLKKQKCEIIFETILENYNSTNLYTAFLYNRRLKAFQFVWLDLNFLNLKKIEAVISTEIISDELGIIFKNMIDNEPISLLNFESSNSTYNQVTLTFNQKKSISFINTMPEGFDNLARMILILFESLPKKLEVFGVDLVFNYLHPNNRPNNEHVFDLEKDKAEVLFTSVMTKKAKKLEIINLDKIDQNFISVVVDEGKKNIVVIAYDEANKKVNMRCSCACNSPCNHQYIVLKTIQKETFKPFYKVVYALTNDNLYAKIIDRKSVV